MARDPRWTPAVGDCLRIGSLKGTVERTVVAVYDGRVDFTSKGKQHSTAIKRWRDWSKGSRIVKFGKT